MRNIKQLAKEIGIPAGELTVLKAENDPYRQDTPANRRKADWLMEQYAKLHDGSVIHLRGFHYKLVGRATRLDGSAYTNTFENWTELVSIAATARYLGLLPFDALRDAKNSAPQIFTPELEQPTWTLQAGEVEMSLPDVLEPQFHITGNLYQQPHRQVVVAEKQGVESLLLPVCEKRHATLAMPAGEVTITMVYDLLRDAAEDGRPLVIHQLGDFDPAGWQMAISTGRKVQRIVDQEFPDLEVKLHAVSMTKDQCETWNLPSSPLKATEQRGTKWLAATGREQTELDAAVAMVPDDFAKVVDQALLQYFDRSLERRGRALKQELETEANTRLAGELGEDVLARIRDGAQEKLDVLENMAAEINEQLTVDVDDIGVTHPDALDVLVGDSNPTSAPLVDTSGWLESTRRLIQRKNYDV